MKKVSIIITLYNLKHFVKDAIQSVVDQTYTNRECIIVNDCSTDWGFEYTKKLISNDYAQFEHKFFVVKNEKNSWVWKTFEHGLSLISGEYVADLDADDVWKENKLAIQIDFMEKNPKYIMTCHDMIVVSKDLDQINPSLIHQVWKRDVSKLQADRVAFCKSSYCIWSSIVFQRKLIQYIVPFSKYIYQDIWISNVANLIWIIGYIDAPLCLYRQHGANNEWLTDFLTTKKPVESIMTRFEKFKNRLSKNIPKYFQFYADLKPIADNHADDDLFMSYLNKRYNLYCWLNDWKNCRINTIPLVLNIYRSNGLRDLGILIIYMLNEKLL